MSTPTPPSAAVIDPRARQTLDRLGETLPVRPGPLLDLLASDGTRPDEIACIIERDPALSARVLGVVNSAGNRRLHEVVSVSRAVLQLGAAPVRLLGLAMGVQVLTEQLGLPTERLTGFWNASLYKAEAAHLAARAIDPARQKSAYSVGLIADLGLPLLMALDPDFYENRIALRPGGQSWAEYETQHFGIDHARVGAYALERWGVHAELCRRVASHHDLPGDDPDAGLVLALFIAGVLPHDDNEMDPRELDRLLAVYGKVLSSTYASPDAFLAAVYHESRRRMNADGERDDARGLPTQPFLDAITANTVGLVGELSELNDAKEKCRQDIHSLRFEAFTDPLTKVLNRRGFFSLAQQRIEQETAGIGGCCMMLDLDEFKRINDRYGHDAGDLMLRGMAKLLRRSVARHDLIGRLGGDEFVVMLIGVDEHDARVAATRLRDNCLDTLIRIGPNVTVPLTFSMGVVFHANVGGQIELDRLITAADDLMYQRKRGGSPGMIFARLDGETDATAPTDSSRPDA